MEFIDKEKRVFKQKGHLSKWDCVTVSLLLFFYIWRDNQVQLWDEQACLIKITNMLDDQWPRKSDDSDKCWRIVRRKWWKFVKNVPQLLRDFDAHWDGWWWSVDEAEKRGRHLQVMVMMKDGVWRRGFRREEDWKREGGFFNHFRLWFWSIPQQNQSSKRWC